MEKLAAAAYLIILALMYIVPYTVLREAKEWSLYSFWAFLGLAALALSWAGTRGWGGNGG